MKTHIEMLSGCLFWSLVLFFVILGINCLIKNNLLFIDNNAKLYFLSAVIQSNCALFGLILVSIGISPNIIKKYKKDEEYYGLFFTINIFLFVIIILSIFSMLMVTNDFLTLYIACMEILVVFLILEIILKIIKKKNEELENSVETEHCQSNDSVI